MRFILFFIAITWPFFLSCQQLYTTGTEFWMAFNDNYNGGSTLEFNITSKYTTTGNISCAAIGFNQNFSVVANSKVTVTMPVTGRVYTSNLIENKGVHIVSVDSITINAANYKNGTADGTALLEISSLGTSYRAMGCLWSGSYRDALTVVGTVNGTVVTITPSVNTINGQLANVPFNINLNQGQTYQIQTSSGDVLGTTVVSTQPVAVFTSNACADMPVNRPYCTDPTITYCDHLFEQMIPTDTWGTEYATGKLMGRTGGDYFRIMAHINGTNVYHNGSLIATLNAGQYVCGTWDLGNYFTSNQPINVAQFARGRSADGTPSSDPFQITIIPTSFWAKEHLFCTSTTGFTATHHISVVIDQAYTGTVLLDGSPLGVTWNNVPASTLKYAIKQVSNGAHALIASKEFGACMYGWGINGSSCSYGYSTASGAKVIVLDAELGMLTVQKVGNSSALLNWTTLSEKDLDEFIVERSMDGILFEEVGTVSANGNSTKTNSYKFLDEKLKGSNIYYRLKLVDINGDFINSNLVTISLDHASSFGIIDAYPNPTDRDLFLKIALDHVANASISLLNIEGELVFYKTLDSRIALADEHLDLSDLPQGMYLLRLINGNKTNTQRIIIY